MKNTLTLFLLLALGLSACSQTVTEPLPTEPIQDTSTEETYTWTKHNLSFVVPEGLVVSDMPEVDMVILDTVDRTSFEGELLDYISIRPSEKNLNAYVQDLKDSQATSEHQVTEETITAGDNTYTKVTFYSEFGGYTVTEYLMEKNGSLWVVREGLDSQKTQTILESLTF